MKNPKKLIILLVLQGGDMIIQQESNTGMFAIAGENIGEKWDIFVLFLEQINWEQRQIAHGQLRELGQN